MLIFCEKMLMSAELKGVSRDLCIFWIFLQKLSSCYVSLSDWLTTIFLNPWKNQKYLFIINLFTYLLQMKLFLRNNIAFRKKDSLDFLQENSLNFGLVTKSFARRRPPRSPVPYLHNLKLLLFQCILLQKIPWTCFPCLAATSRWHKIRENPDQFKPCFINSSKSSHLTV